MIRYMLLTLALLTGCLKTDIVYGTSEVVTKTDSLSHFSGTIIVSADLPIQIDSGSPSVSLTADENLHKYFYIDTTNGQITIAQSNEFKLITSELAVKITVPYITMYRASHGITTSHVTISDTSKLVLSAGASYTGSIFSPCADILVVDSAKLQLKGEISRATLHFESSKPTMIDSLDLYRATVYTSQSEALTIDVTRELELILAGSGDVILKTLPIFKGCNISGTGNVLYRANEESAYDTLNQVGADTIFAL